MSQQVTTSSNNIMIYPESNIILITIILTPLAPSNFETLKGKEETKVTLDLVRQNILENESNFGCWWLIFFFFWQWHQHIHFKSFIFLYKLCICCTTFTKTNCWTITCYCIKCLKTQKIKTNRNPCDAECKRWI